MTIVSKDELTQLDARDPLAAYRDLFELPQDVIYLDGNSLGPLPRAVKARVAEVIENQWGHGLVRSWNLHDWVNLPRKLGDKIASLIGAEAGEVIAADSTSVNLFKLLSGALPLRPERRVIVSDIDNFPTDLYMAEGINELMGAKYELRFVKTDDVAAAIDGDTAVVMLTEVNYRTGARYEMQSITELVHAHGALMLWDLAHSAGAFPVDLNGCNVDFAVGCGYKYLNGGPGAPAFLFVAKRLQRAIRPVLSGWFGHAAPFDFAPDYAPADDLRRMLCGTPAILGLVALDAALNVFSDVDLVEVRNKSVALTETFIRLVEDHFAGFGLSLVTPRNPVQRGSQICFSHPYAYAVMQAVIDRGVIGDFRAPDILRFGFAPLYLRYSDCWNAAMRLKDVLVTEVWREPRYAQRNAVT